VCVCVYLLTRIIPILSCSFLHINSFKIGKSCSVPWIISSILHRHSREHSRSLSIDTHDDVCLVRTNLTDHNLYLAFERLIDTHDHNDIRFTSNISLIFFMGSYTDASDSIYIETQASSIYHQSMTKNLDLLACSSSKTRVLPLFVFKCCEKKFWRTHLHF
jgi:hypothetical protein